VGKQRNQIWTVLIGAENKEPKIYALPTYRLTDSCILSLLLLLLLLAVVTAATAVVAAVLSQGGSIWQCWNSNDTNQCPTFSLVSKTAHTKPVTSDLCTIQSNSYQWTLFPQHFMPPTFSPQFLNSSHKACHIWSMHNSIQFLSMNPISSTSISLAGFLSFATQMPNQLIKLTPWSTALLQTQIVTQMNNKTPHQLWNFQI
jgi:hypothetical protein